MDIRFPLTSWYYANGLYGCWRMLDRLISTRPIGGKENNNIDLQENEWDVSKAADAILHRDQQYFWSKASKI